MSGRYSSSPELRLSIGSSRLRASFHGLLCLAAGAALWAICERGYVLSALVLAPCSAGLLWRLRRETAAGALLGWRGGVWTLQDCGEQRVITPLPRCAATPWIIYLVFIDTAEGVRRELWLYVDAVAPSQWRRLRVRLTLMH